DWFSPISVPSRSIRSTNPSYSACDPSHHTVRSGRVSPPAESTHFSTTLVTAMQASFARWKTPCAPSSVGHQYRNGDLPQEVPRRSAEHALAQPRVSVGANDDEVGADVERAGEQGIIHPHIVGIDGLRLDADAVARQ